MAFNPYKDYSVYAAVDQHVPDSAVYRAVFKDIDNRLTNIEHYLEYRLGDALQLDKVLKAAKLLRAELKEIEMHGVRMDKAAEAIAVIEDAFPQTRYE